MPEPRAARIRHETDLKIAQATLSIALVQGAEAVTVEKVAARAGVAKTTIYRRYRDRDDLLSNIGNVFRVLPPENADVAPTRDGLVAVTQSMREGFEEHVGLRAMGLLLASDAEFFRQVAERTLHPQRKSLVDFLRRGVTEGSLEAHLDAELVVDLIIGGLIVRASLVRAGVADGMPASWSETIVDFLWPRICAEEHPAADDKR